MKLMLAATMPLLAVACAPLPPMDTSSEFVAVADTASPVSVLEAGPTVSYNARRVEEPGDWTSMNYDLTESAE